MDPAAPLAESPKAGGLDWCAVTIVGKNLEVTLIEVHLRPGEIQEVAVTFSQIKAFLAQANTPYLIVGDFNLSPARLSESGMLCGLNAVPPTRPGKATVRPRHNQPATVAGPPL